MKITEDTVEALVERYIKSGQVIAFGTSDEAEVFAKKLALKMERDGIEASVVPTSAKLSEILHSLGVPIVSIDGKEIDVAIEFVDAVDGNFNFIKRDSSSLVRDKMIAQSAAELIVIAHENEFVKKLGGKIPFEVATFGAKRTLVQLEKLGKASIRMEKGKPFKTETNHYLIYVEVDDVYSLEDLDYQAKEIPGVLETGLFIGYADRIITTNGHLKVRSRMDYSKEMEEEPPELKNALF